MKTLHVRIEGRVQGVGFRWWVEEEARRRRLSGWVRNRRDGSVEAVFSGDDASVDDMVAACGRGPSAAHVDKVEAAPTDDAVAGFRTLSTV